MNNELPGTRFGLYLAFASCHVLCNLDRCTPLILLGEVTERDAMAHVPFTWLLQYSSTITARRIDREPMERNVSFQSTGTPRMPSS